MTEGYSLPRRLDTDPESLQRDLMKLVLTIIELVRQLMERQAIRRSWTGRDRVKVAGPRIVSADDVGLVRADDRQALLA